MDTVGRCFQGLYKNGIPGDIPFALFIPKTSLKSGNYTWVCSNCK